MRTLILEPLTAGSMRCWTGDVGSGLDRLDEVWEGVRHMVPAPPGEHAYVAQQLAVLLDRPCRDAGLVPSMGDFNLGESR